ncbi:hypothetical protein [Shimia sp. R9_3]|uniref:hypothetical protein n=1 Tax=Shimia sp. R9_3 TaxID=2821113 RepID=UPI001ADC9097|nr:hypothetical protein [Shimia sp. R9_3]MBO9400934.1 hypothetical protein [Shimia sp. R9_3]
MAAIVCGFWLWLSPKEKTDDQLAVEYYRALDLSIEALEVLLGEDLVPSDTFSVQTINGLRPDDTPESRVRKLLTWFDPVGLNPMNIIFYDSDYPTNYWKVRFPGCQPGGCSPLLQQVELVLASEDEWFQYHAGKHHSKKRELVFEPELIGSSTYYAEVDVHSDFADRVTKIDLFVYRNFVGELEMLSSTLTNGGPTERRQIYYRRKILSDAGNTLSEDG